MLAMQRFMLHSLADGFRLCLTQSPDAGYLHLQEEGDS